MRAFGQVVACILITASALGCTSYARAEDKTVKLDVVLMMDSSGSLLETDARRLRDVAAKQFINLLQPHDKLAVVPFADTAQIVQSLAPINDELKTAVGSAIEKLSPEGLYTDYVAAITKAEGILAGSIAANRTPIIVLFTDGRFEPAPESESTEEKLYGEMLPLLREGKIRVFAIGVGSKVDKVALERIAKTTDGAAYVAENADALTSAFEKVYQTATLPRIDPTLGKIFSLETELSETTFFIGRKPTDATIVLSPVGKRLTRESFPANVKWHAGEDFDLVSVTSPETGNWQIGGFDPEMGFAAQLTNLRLVAIWPSQVVSAQGAKVSARLYDGDKPVNLNSIGEVSEFYAEAIPTDRVSQPIERTPLADGGTNGDLYARDGEFSGIIKIEEPGEYRLRVVIKAPTFERSQLIPFRVKPRPVSLLRLSRQDAEASGVDVAESLRDLGPEVEPGLPPVILPTPPDAFFLEVSSEAQLWKKQQIRLVATDAEGKKFILPFTRIKGLAPRFIATPYLLPHAGDYELVAYITGEGRGKAQEKGESKPIKYNLEKIPFDLEALMPKKEVHVEESHTMSYIGMMLAPLVAGGLAFVGKGKIDALQKSGGAKRSIVAELSRSERDKLALLEKRIAQEEIDLNDPLFTIEQRAAAAPQPTEAGA